VIILKSEFENLTLDQTYSRLESSSKGLDDRDIPARHDKYGFNEVISKKESGIKKFASKFWSPIPWMLEITIVITAVLGKYRDMYIIAFLLLFNGVLSFLQESRAQNAVELLKQKLHVKARVLRDGKWKQVEARDLVPGDVIHIRNGDIVPADLKIIRGDVQVDQSSLTGESLPVSRSSAQLLYSASTVKKGEADAIVIYTGSKTLFGKTTDLVATAGSKSHIEKLILGIVKYLVVIDSLLVVSIVAFSYYIHIPTGDIIPFALVVLITSIPVALPATFTIAMSVGAAEMSKKGVLVTRLTAIEDAASMDVVCLDKTGTITKNVLSVMDPITYDCTEKDLLSYAVVASDSSSEDSIDDAVIEYAKLKGYFPDISKRTSFIPFDPHTKRTEALIEAENGTLKLVKGSPPVLMKLYSYPEKMTEDVDNLSKKGYRVIAVAIEDGEKRILGLIPLHDPPREDSSKLIKELKDLSIDSKMVTGDSKAIAGEIASQVGIGTRTCDVSDALKGTGSIDNYDVFSEVFPEDKYAIVKKLQNEGHIVGMTGDGVNDAPALKQAEVGISVSTGTDVAKAAASIVLTHEGVSDIVESVKSGRRIYQRMLTYILNKIIKTIQVVFFLTISFFIFRFFATTPFDIILLIFANDFVTMSIATDNARYSLKPEKWGTRHIITTSGILAALLVGEGLLALYIAIGLGLSHPEIDTFIFDILVFSGQFTVYMVRERDRFWKSRPGKWLLLASAADIIFVSLISFSGILVTAIPYTLVLFAIALTFIWMAFMDTFKNIIFRRYGL
jgi:H+-transporting ATPase